MCEGDEKVVLFNSAVSRSYVLMQGKQIYAYTFYIIQILHQNIAQIIIKCYYSICVSKTYLIVLRRIFDPKYKQKNQIKKYMWSIYN